MLRGMKSLIVLMFCSNLYAGIGAKRLLVKTKNLKIEEHGPPKHDDYKVTIDDRRITQENYHCQQEKVSLKGVINRQIEEINHAVCTSDFQIPGKQYVYPGNIMTTLPVFGHEFYISLELYLSNYKQQQSGWNRVKKNAVFSIVDKSRCPRLRKKNRKKCTILDVYTQPSKLKLVVKKYNFNGQKPFVYRKKLHKFSRFAQVTMEQFPKRNGKLLFQIKYDDMIGSQWEVEEPSKHENVIVYASNPWDKKENINPVRNVVISAFEKELTTSETEESYESDYD